MPLLVLTGALPLELDLGSGAARPRRLRFEPVLPADTGQVGQCVLSMRYMSGITDYVPFHADDGLGAGGLFDLAVAEQGAAEHDAQHDRAEQAGAALVATGLIAPEQLALADFITEGHLERHARRHRPVTDHRNRITRIAAKGLPLDPNQHQAMLEVPNGEVEPGTVLQELQAGYMIKDRLLRPAMVAVAKKPE